MATITRYMTVVLGLIQAIGLTVGLFRRAIVDQSAFNMITIIIVLTAGTAFLMWLGEQINEYGVGNGISMIIFAGIVARLPSAVRSVATQVKDGAVSIVAVIVLLIAAGGIGVLGLWLPFLFASFGLIWEKSFGSKGWLIGAIVFVVMAAVSPIMFVVRLKSRADQRKVLAEAIAHNQYMRQLNDKYLTQARQKKSGLTSASIQELLNKTAALQKKEEEVAKRMEQAQAAGDNSQVEALRKELESVKAQAAEAKATADDAKQNSVSNEEMEKALAAFESNVSGALNDLEGKGKAKSRKSA
jgi:hypothetical protein